MGYYLDSLGGVVLQTHRTTNPAHSIGGKLYTDKQTFHLTAQASGTCKIDACSASQGFSVYDASTNYCDMRNLYCGKRDGCTPVLHDFIASEESVKPSVGAVHDFSKCVVKPSLVVQV